MFYLSQDAWDAYTKALTNNAAPAPTKYRYLLKYYRLGTGTWRPLTEVDAVSEDDALTIARRTIGDALKDDEVLCADLVLQ